MKSPIHKNSILKTKAINKTFSIVVFLALISILPACRKGGPWGIKGKGENVTETKSVTGFDKIDLSIDADIYYTQDSIYKVEISAQENILAVLETEVSNRTLYFDYKRNVSGHNTVKITIHSPNLESVNMSGSGDVNFENELITNEMELNISGSGAMYLPKLSANTLKLTISGSGDVKIADGILKNENFNISGSGSIDAVNLAAENADVKIIGTGDMKVNVTENLDVTISGSGSLSYKGNPSVSKSLSGSGKVIHLK